MTLREYREEVLRLPQTEVARLAKCTQAWISHLERTGHVPRPWNRERLLKAYELEEHEDEFVRLLKNTAKLIVLKRPATEDNTPLLAQEVMHSDNAKPGQISGTIEVMRERDARKIS